MNHCLGTPLPERHVQRVPRCSASSEWVFAFDRESVFSVNRNDCSAWVGICAIMPGTGGFRKMRWGDSRRGKGTRGGLRVIYYHFVEDEQVWLMTLCGKDEIDDLTPGEKGILKNAIAAERRARAARK